MIRILLFCLISLLSSPGLLLAREVFFYHNDNTGTPVAMTDSSGKVVWRAHDKPFGEEFQTTEAPEHNSRRFIGKEKDKETGLVYIGARYLDPASGRFLQPDPVGPVDPMTGKVNVEMLTNPQRLNRYAYGLNNPYRYIDPDGESPVLVLGLIGAAASYLSAPDVANAPESPSAPTFKSNGGYSIAAGAAGGVGAGKVAQAVTAAKMAEDNTAGWSRTPKSIQDQMAWSAAQKRGAGDRIMKDLADPKFKGMEKWQYKIKSSQGKDSVIHYVKDPKTGKQMDYKFKKHSTD